MAENKKTVPVWRLEDQEWWQKYSAMVNGNAQSCGKKEDTFACPTAFPGAMPVSSGNTSGFRMNSMTGSGSAGYGISSGSSASSGSGSGSSSGSGSAGGFLAYGLHLL